MKRILALILALLMLTPSAFADNSKMTYRLKGGEGKVGEVVKVVLAVEDAPACVAYDTTISYDPEILQPTGDYQKMYLDGLVVVNTEAEVNGKKMIKVAAVAIKNNLMEGTMDLLNISFKIIGTPKDEQGTIIDVQDYTFSQNNDDLSPVDSLVIVPAYVRVKAGEAVTDPEDAPSTEEQPSNENTPSADKESDAEKAPESDKKDDKEEGGDWYFDGDQAIEYYPDSSKESIQYDVEYEKDDKGNTTGVILYDKEDKTEAGRLEVQEDEYGNLEVTDKQMNKTDKKKGGFSLWFLLPIGAAVLIAIGGVILAIKLKKNK